MALLIGTALAFAFLEWPWRLLVIVPLAAIEAFEIMVFLKWRKVRSITGAEAMVGASGRALTDCLPVGQVKVQGRIWKARCTGGVRAGESVIVEGIDGLTLEVAASARTETGGR
jgi:membrane protein implicated in regulation of membrane protease activity